MKTSNLDSGNRSWWKISLGSKGVFSEKCFEDGVMVMGNYGKFGLGDHLQYSSPKELQKLGLGAKSSHQLWDFFDTVSKGDVVVAYDSNCMTGIGLVDSECQYHEENDDLFFAGENYIREINWVVFSPKISIHKDPILWGNKVGGGPFTRNSTLVKIKIEEVDRLKEVLDEDHIDLSELFLTKQV